MFSAAGWQRVKNAIISVAARPLKTWIAQNRMPHMTILLLLVSEWESPYESHRPSDGSSGAAISRLIADRFDIAGAIVYGSRARGTHRPESDADVAVLLKGERQRFLKTALAMSDVAFDALLETGINISPLPVWLDEWEHPENYTNPALLQNIAREGIRL